MKRCSRCRQEKETVRCSALNKAMNETIILRLCKDCILIPPGYDCIIDKKCYHCATECPIYYITPCKLFIKRQGELIDLMKEVKEGRKEEEFKKLQEHLVTVSQGMKE